MEWNALFPKDKQPGFEDITDYIGGDGNKLWISLFEYMDTSYNAKPKMFYSCCSGKPGWNIKFQKSSQSFGTLYPEQGAFSVFIVISYKLDTVIKTIYNNLSSKIRVCYDNAGDYMKMGKWLMFRVETEDDLNDYILLMSAKMQPKTKP